MAEIKGLVYNNDSVEFITPNGGTITGDLNIDGDLVIDGEVIGPEPSGPIIVDFASGTDEQIAAMLDAHYQGIIDISEYWHVGDTRLIHLNGINSPNVGAYTNPWPAQDITITIIAIDHHDLIEQIGVRYRAAITLQTRECLNNLSGSGVNKEGTIFINLNSNKDTTFTKWSNLPMRTWMNNQFYNTCFDNNLKALIKETKHYRLTTYNKNTTEEVIDKLFLPSYTEVYGNLYNEYYMGGQIPAGEEGIQLDYYKTSSNRIKKGNNNGNPNTGYSCYWWLGSPTSYYSSDTGYGWSVGGDASRCYGYYGDNNCALAPAFCL